MSSIEVAGSGDQVGLQPPRYKAAPVPEDLQTVMVALNSSRHSEYALNWSLEHFFREGGIKKQKIVLYTVEKKHPHFFGADRDFNKKSLSAFDAIEQHEYKECVALLKQYRKKFLERFPNAEVVMVVGHGNAGEDIVEYAERNNVNTVIMGSGTDNAVRRVMLGSVGDYCSHNLACPVVIVKHP